MVEQRSPKPRAEGSSPSAPAKRQFSPVGLSCFFVRANRRRTSNPKDLAFALCKVLTGTGSGAKIVQQSFCPCQKVSQSFWIGFFFIRDGPEACGACRARIPTAACGGRKEGFLAQQSKATATSRSSRRLWKLQEGLRSNPYSYLHIIFSTGRETLSA